MELGRQKCIEGQVVKLLHASTQANSRHGWKETTAHGNVSAGISLRATKRRQEGGKNKSSSSQSISMSCQNGKKREKIKYTAMCLFLFWEGRHTGGKQQTQPWHREPKSLPPPPPPVLVKWWEASACLC